MNTTTKKILNVALKVATWLLVAFTVFMMVFTIVTVATVDKNDRAIFGTRFYIVQTDSMSLSENNKDMDVHFNAGDIILVQDVADPYALEEGDIISFISMNEVSYGETVTHMIREVKRNSNGKVKGYVTFGTNTGASDEALVEPEYIIGKYAGKLPGVGNFFAFVKSVPGYIVCILVPFLLLILYNGVDVIRLFRQYKKEQMEAMQAEKDKIEADRAETQRMMQELLALKAQLEQKSGESSAPVASPAPTTVEQVESCEPEVAEEAVETTEEPSAFEEHTEENSGESEPEAPAPEEAVDEAVAEEIPTENIEPEEEEAENHEVIEEPAIPDSQIETEESEKTLPAEPASEAISEEESTEEPNEATEEIESPVEENSDEK